ncbi:hypothetical protein MMA231_02504 [Asticcacaulis sp. MM231]|uniref:hypothetical protein n=1 Tax=Asticcacaulis sp. MM231 TaxID=3157666 RepID=UPI0032D57754
MNAINLTDVIHAATYVKDVTHALSIDLRQLAAVAAIDVRHHLTVAAAAAEAASERAMLIVESTREVN